MEFYSKYFFAIVTKNFGFPKTRFQVFAQVRHGLAISPLGGEGASLGHSKEQLLAHSIANSPLFCMPIFSQTGTAPPGRAGFDRI